MRNREEILKGIQRRVNTHEEYVKRCEIEVKELLGEGKLLMAMNRANTGLRARNTLRELKALNKWAKNKK